MFKEGTSKISFCQSTCESTNLSIRLRLRPEAEAEATVLDQLYYEQRKGNMFMAERCKMSCLHGAPTHLVAAANIYEPYLTNSLHGRP